jgi:hypothetical protein
MFTFCAQNVLLQPRMLEVAYATVLLHCQSHADVLYAANCSIDYNMICKEYLLHLHVLITSQAT